MRITGGSARSIPLRTLPNKDLRPATDRMREAVFSSLGHTVVDKTVLDLFAGSGSYGLEALSRGASRVTFVERSTQQTVCLKANLFAATNSLKISPSHHRVYKTDTFKWNPADKAFFDLIFADPPYAALPKYTERLFTRVRDWIAPKPSSLFMLEAPGNFNYEPSGWSMIRRLGKGNEPAKPVVFFYRFVP